MKAVDIQKELFSLADEQKRDFLPYFFKTRKGEYGYGDKFIGVVVPKQRALVSRCKPLDINEIEILLHSEYHECRLTALLFLIERYKNAKKELSERQDIFDFYISNHKYVNNWDLVDLSAPKIVGQHLLDKDKSILLSFAKNDDLWLQRISIVSTIIFIKKDIYRPTLDISLSLLSHKHDLIHKAVGWMLREVGKRDFMTEYNFLVESDRYNQMPRTMLRYAVEKFSEDIRQDFLKGRI